MFTNKLLFLDFDGVLHPNLCGPSLYFCEGERLHSLIRDSSAGLEVVISSSWRFHYTIDRLQALLPPSVGRLVTGVTPCVAPGKHQRFREISAFLDIYPKASDWRALDDAAFEFPQICPQLILCNGNTGIDNRAADAVRSWLEMR